MLKMGTLRVFEFDDTTFLDIEPLSFDIRFQTSASLRHVLLERLLYKTAEKRFIYGLRRGNRTGS